MHGQWRSGALDVKALVDAARLIRLTIRDGVDAVRDIGWDFLATEETMDATASQFIKTITVAAGTIGAPGSVSGDQDVAAQAGGFGTRRLSLFFPQSVASGDPKPTSVIVWTRVVDGEAPVERFLTLEVARDEGFQPGDLVVSTQVAALAEHDGCVRVKITDLEPDTFYYYRFLYQANERISTNIGRTKTAPEESDERPVRFAFASCQDFIERYYNGYLPLLTEEARQNIDFIVHLGDFIYETTRDRGLPPGDSARRIRFRDEAGAIDLREITGDSFAARSLDNYRQLYQTYRSDIVLQAVLESYPLIATWDDHEFSDDSWQDHATYLDDRDPDLEKDTERKRNAERAWFEYIPVDLEDSDTGANRLPPKIYRAFRFGNLLQLILTDYRTFRPNHLVDEGAFPGAIFATEQQLRSAFGDEAFERLFLEGGRRSLVARFRPVVRWETLSFVQKLVLLRIFAREYRRAGYLGNPEARAAEVLSGALDADYLNLRLLLFPFLRIDTGRLPRGVAIGNLNKLALFSGVGARFGSDFDVFEVFVSTLRQRGEGNQDAYGPEQETFLREALGSGSSGTGALWKVVANAVSSTALIVDVTEENLDAHLGPGSGFPLLSLLAEVIKRTPLARRYAIRLDQWDGLPDKREELLAFYRGLGGDSTVVLIAGDIHASFVADHSSAAGRIFEFTGPAISAPTLVGELQGFFSSLGSSSLSQGSAEDFLERLGAVNELGDVLNGIRMIGDQLRLPNIPDIPAISLEALLEELARAFDSFLIEKTPTSPFRPSLDNMRIEDADTDRHGVVVVDVTDQHCEASYFLIEPSLVSAPLYEPTQPDAIESAVNAYFALPVGTRGEGGLRQTKRFRVSPSGAASGFAENDISPPLSSFGGDQARDP